MADLSPAARRSLDAHLAEVRQALRTAGQEPDDIDLAMAALREQVLDAVVGDGRVGRARMQEVLADLDPPDRWAEDAASVGAGGRSKDIYGWAALIAALTTLGVAVLGGSVADAAGRDGGAVATSVGLFGFAASLTMAAFDRRSWAAKAALVLVMVAVGLFVGLAVFTGG